MLIWKGDRGLFVFLIAIGGLIFGALVSGLFSSMGRDRSLAVGVGFGFLIAAFLVYRLLVDHSPSNKLDEITGEVIGVKKPPEHSLFFIPVRFWTFIYLFIGITSLISVFSAPGK